MKELYSRLVFDSNLVSPLVTIGIPAFKSGKLLNDAVCSALCQNFDEPFEILVVNDNPQGDDVTQLMMEYRKRGNVAYYMNAKNLGPTGNWNAMYALAKGQYVVMLQDDDVLSPYYLKVMFRFMEETSYKYELLYPQHYVSKKRDFSNLPIPPNRIRYRIMKYCDYLVTQWGLPTGLMIERTKYYQTGGYKNEFFPINDQEYIYRALHYVRGCQILFPMVLYYVGENLSLKPETLIQGIVKVKEFNKMMHMDKSNIWHSFAPFCLRQQIVNMERWSRNFSNEIEEESRIKVGITRNSLKDKVSEIVCIFLKAYIKLVRFKSFNF